MLEDVELTEEIIITKDKNVKLNLNGKTISSTAINTINNQGTLTITSSGIIRNESENGTVIYNTGTVNMENGIITTNKNGGKAVYNVTENTSNSGTNASANSNNGNASGVFNMKAGKIVTEGIGAVGIYNSQDSKVTMKGGIIEITGYGNKAIYNNSSLEITGGKIIVSGEDAMGIYNGKTSKTCVIKLPDAEKSVSQATDEASIQKQQAESAKKAPEIIVQADEIENYEIIKNTDQFKEQLDKMKPSYGIYNDSEKEIIIEAVTIKVERLKGVGIFNGDNGIITLGIEDKTINSATPIIYAIADNTTALQNSTKGQINFYDGRFVTTSSVKDLITKILQNCGIVENVNQNNINTTIAPQTEDENGDTFQKHEETSNEATTEEEQENPKSDSIEVDNSNESKSTSNSDEVNVVNDEKNINEANETNNTEQINIETTGENSKEE